MSIKPPGQKLDLTRKEFEEAIPRIMGSLQIGNLGYACIHFDENRAGELAGIKSMRFLCSGRTEEVFLDTKISRRCPLRDDRGKCLLTSDRGTPKDLWLKNVEEKLKKWARDNMGPRTVQLTLFEEEGR